MKTIDLCRSRLSMEELLKLAERGAVRIITAEGRAFVLEDAGDFDKEVEAPSKSKKGRRAVNDTTKGPATLSFEDYRRSLA